MGHLMRGRPFQMAEPDSKRQRTVEKKRLLITGGSNGIGAAIALDWGMKGHAVFITGREEADCRSICERIRAAGGTADFALGDVSSTEDVKKACASAEAFFGDDHIDVLVANAGCGGGRLAVEECGDDLFDKQFATNVKGVFLFIKEILPGMKRRREGQIVVTSSTAGLHAVRYGAVYASTKWAVEGLVRSVREELQGTGVKIGTINPGYVATKWRDEPHRGGPRPDGATLPPAMLQAEDCAVAARTLIDQARSCDIGSIILDPASS